MAFDKLGVIEKLCESCKELGWDSPTPIQIETIPHALKGKDVIALAETGSGKTGAFALPIIQTLMANPQRLYALVLTPTRDLAKQIKEQFDVLGRHHGLKCCTIVGETDLNVQILELSKKPHIVVATPGRLANHLEKTKNFKLDKIKYLVLDEADQTLNQGFEEEVDKILKSLPKKRTTMLFSATMTEKVKKLKRTHLRDPVRVEVSWKFKTVDKLQQKMIFIPFNLKNLYLMYILQEKICNELCIIFCNTQDAAHKVALMLRRFGMSATPIHGGLNQQERTEAIKKFKDKDRSILVGTDVISRGLDIPNVDYVINYDLPKSNKDYIHRVGRTARAGKSGTAITMVTQYEIEKFLMLEHVLGEKLEVFSVDETEVKKLEEKVECAEREAKMDMKQVYGKRKLEKRKRNNEDNDDETSLGIRKKIKYRNNKDKINKKVKRKRK